MTEFLFKIFVTALLLIAWWYLKRYLKKTFGGSFRSNLWSFRLRFSYETLGKGKLKIKQVKGGGLTISLEAEGLDKGGYSTASVLIGDNQVLKIYSNELLDRQRKIHQTLSVEPVDGDEIIVLVDDMKVVSGVFNVKREQLVESEHN